MSSLIEMRQKSLEFRRLSSNLLKSTREDADVNLARFAKFIEDDVYVHDLIHAIVGNSQYDFRDCFHFEGDGWAQTTIPVDEKDHIKAQYDFLQYILQEGHVLGMALQYPYRGGEKYDDIIRDFLNTSFKPLIDFIVDSMSKEMILMDEKTPLNTLNIGTVNGNAIMQSGDGTINATANVTIESKELISLIDRLLPELDKLQDDAPADDIEDVKDDLEVLREQVQSLEPKPSRMKKALAGIKKFGNDVLVKLTVSLASSAILKADWPVLIQQAETFISGYLN